MANNKNINKLIEFLSLSINQNLKTASELCKWIRCSSPVQKDILKAKECIETATYTLNETREQLRGIPQKEFGFLSQSEIDKIAERASSLMPDDPSLHYHCSEAFTIAVGEHFFGQVDDRIRRMTTGFAGGIGGTHDEMCGALFGGVLIIGAIYGRARSNEDDEISYKKSVIYKEQFIKEFNGTLCQELKDTGYGSDGTQPCSVLVGKAVKVFFKSLMLE
ncbi:MAG TPA: C_GCAxxG_C_C family protein [Anaerolineae bacterium]|nr:C_GCAxxG_C_C family protein [Anaerolineae bacterium]